MLGLFRERRSTAAMSHVAATMLEGVQTLSPVDRAATLAIAHAMLRSAAERWGRAVIERPSSLSRGTAASIVVMLADAHSKVAGVVRSLEGRGMGDAAYAQAMRQLRATEVVMGVVGRRFGDKAASRAVSDSWKALWTARGRAEEAADVLVRFRDVTGADALPRPAGAKGPPARADLIALASTLPAVFRRPDAPRRTPPRAAAPPTAIPQAPTAARTAVRTPRRSGVVPPRGGLEGA